MRYHDVTLHNIAEAVSREDGSVALQRVPESVRLQLDEPARQRTLEPGGAEVRFVDLRGDAKVTLSAEPVNDFAPVVTVYHGPFASRPFSHPIGTTPTTIDAAVPADFRDKLESVPDQVAAGLRYHPRVVRVVLRHGMFRLHGIDGEIRPPHVAELPDLTMLSYGTSITHGSASSLFHLSYVSQTAWRLGTDLVNFGVGGACLCEPAFGDHLTGRDDWDVATLSLSVNMIGRGFSVEEFTERAGYVVEQVVTRNPDKPVFCISIYPYHGDWADLQPDAKAPPDAFRQALAGIVEKLRAGGADNVQLIPGPELLTDIAGLSVDMIHPADHGMIQMGEHLAARMLPAVDALRRAGVNRRQATPGGDSTGGDS